MKSQRKSMNSKSLVFQLLTALLIGATGLIPRISLAEPSDGMSNAKSHEPAVERDPFWPVGYMPVKVQNEAENNSEKIVVDTRGSTDWSEAMKQVVINGVSSRAGNEYVAVINNEVKVVGESISILFEGTHYVWQVDSITPPSSVKLRRLSAE